MLSLRFLKVWVGGAIVLLLCICGLAAPLLAPRDPQAQTLEDRLRPPRWAENGSPAYLLGTDNLGRDMLSRIIYGSRISLIVGAATVIFAGLLGCTLGAVAGYFGGWALYMKGGRVVHDYNFFGLSHTKVASPKPLAAGAHTIVYEFVPDEAGKPGTGGTSILSVDGQVVAEGHVPKTQPYTFSGDEGVDVGSDNETMVSDDYQPGATDFRGEIVKVTVAQL